jgi:hypothetical protein
MSRVDSTRNCGFYGTFLTQGTISCQSVLDLSSKKRKQNKKIRVLHYCHAEEAECYREFWMVCIENYERIECRVRRRNVFSFVFDVVGKK